MITTVLTTVTQTTAAPKTFFVLGNGCVVGAEEFSRYND